MFSSGRGTVVLMGCFMTSRELPVALCTISVCRATAGNVYVLSVAGSPTQVLLVHSLSFLYIVYIQHCVSIKACADTASIDTVFCSCSLFIRQGSTSQSKNNVSVLFGHLSAGICKEYVSSSKSGLTLFEHPFIYPTLQHCNLTPVKRVQIDSYHIP